MSALYESNIVIVSHVDASAASLLAVADPHLFACLIGDRAHEKVADANACLLLMSNPSRGNRHRCSWRISTEFAGVCCDDGDSLMSALAAKFPKPRFCGTLDAGEDVDEVREYCEPFQRNASQALIGLFSMTTTDGEGSILRQPICYDDFVGNTRSFMESAKRERDRIIVELFAGLDVEYAHII